MRRIVVDMQNYLFADAVALALKNSDSDFDVHMSEKPEDTAELCSLCVSSIPALQHAGNFLPY